MHMAADLAISNGSLNRAGEHDDGSECFTGGVGGLLQALRTAQAALQLPEVQEMLWRLSEYKLGIFMPHSTTNTLVNFSRFPMT